VVARLVRNCVNRDIGRASATAALLDEAAMETVGKPVGMTDAAVKEALDPLRFVETRVTRGSVAPAEVDRLLGSAGAENQADAQWLRAERERIAASARQLAAAVGAIVA
jgi:argininosuccinate lyase